MHAHGHTGARETRRERSPARPTVRQERSPSPGLLGMMGTAGNAAVAEMFRRSGQSAGPSGPSVQRQTDGDGKQLVIQGDDGPVTVRSASDLLVWLMSHPTRPAPANYAEPDVLRRVLARLEGAGGAVGAAAVWAAVRAVVTRVATTASTSSESDSDEEGGFFRTAPARRNTDSSSEEESEAESETASETGEDWDAGHWDTDEFGAPEAAEFRREMPEGDIAEQQRTLSASLSGYRFVGFHGTNAENVGGLIIDGPDVARIASGHGIGKGRGFYVAPVVGPPGAKAPGTAAAKKEARLWGRFLVAVYVADDVTVGHHADESDGGVEFEDTGASGSGPEMAYHGSDELVIPEQLFGKIKLVRNVDDVTMPTASRQAGAVPYEDGVSAYRKTAKGKGRR
ncbi:hypothetical protein ACIPSJ_14815 [Streptomyces sp. NPDC090088]|uniref:hypothetical protein n=1 Tax=Streptomyces sp. NPDC090088 TaxID=3365944 RepID=UPI00382C558E